MKKFGAWGQRILKIAHLFMASLWLGGALALNLMLAALGPGLAAAADPVYLANPLENIVGGWAQMAALIFMVVISVLKPSGKRF